MPQVSMSDAETKLCMKLVQEEKKKTKDENYTMMLTNLIERFKRKLGIK